MRDLVFLPLFLSLLFFAGCQVKSKTNSSGIIVNHVPVNSKWTIVSPSNGFYKTGDVLIYSFTSTQDISVTGTPRVAVTIGSITRHLNYLDSTGPKTIRFSYTVQAGELDTNGIVLTSPIDLNGGTISYPGSIAADLIFIVPNNPLVRVDAIPPTILATSLSVAKTYVAGDILSVYVSVSEAVAVTGNSRVAFDIGGVTRYADYFSGNGTSFLTFNYTVAAGQLDSDGIMLPSNLLDIQGTIRDQSAQNLDPAMDDLLPLPDTSLHFVDSIAPTITLTTLPADGTYKSADNMNFTFQFSETVLVTNAPRYLVTLNSGTVYATYLSGSGTNTLTFRRIVASPDLDTNGIAVASVLDLNSTGTIRDTAGNNVVLTLTPPSSAGILVDAVVPTVTLNTPALINLANVTNYSLSGTCSENGRNITVAVGSYTVAPAPTCSGLVWSATGVNVSSASDGTAVVVTADHSDAAGNNAVQATTTVVKDTVAPYVVTNTSVNANYVDGNDIPMTVTFNETVTKTGSPRVPVTFASGTRNMIYDSGSPSAIYSFKYTVVTGDADADGIAAGPNLDLNGGTLKDAAGNDALLPLNTTSFPNVKIIPPVTLAFVDLSDYNFGSIPIGGSAEKTYLIDYTGSTPATSVGGTFTDVRFRWKGGSFPGTGGTCAASVSADCTVVIEYIPTTATADSAVMTINYSAGSITKNLLGTGVALTPTKLKITSGPSGVIINNCVPFTISSVTASDIAANVSSNTAISLVVNNGTGTFYSNSGCTTSTTTTQIDNGTSSKIIYFQSTVAAQTLTLIFNTTGLSNTSHNITTSNAPSAILASAAAEIETTICSPVEVSQVDGSGIKTGSATAKTINITNPSSALFYSDSFCTQAITSVGFAMYEATKFIYTKDAVEETASLTFTDAGAILSSDGLTIDFVDNLTWWDTDWAKRKRITLNNNDQATAFTNMPVLVRLNSSRISYASFLSGGEDIRFTLSDHTTVLNHEIETWNPSGESLIWVRVPALSASAETSIYMYYDNTSALDAQNASGLWTGFSGIWNMNKTGANYLDSTGSGKTAAPVGTVADIAGPSGNAVYFNGASSIDTGYNLAQIIGRTSTLSFWIRTTQVGNNTNWQAPGVTGVEQSGGGNDIFFGYILADGRIAISSGDSAAAPSNFIVNDNNWRYVSMTRDEVSGAVQFFVNGVLNGSATSDTGYKTTAFQSFGLVGNTGGGPNYFNGYLDGIRLHATIKSAAQIKAEYKFLVDTHLTYGQEEDL
ncbi:MAG: DUF2341 domain-containing protein [Bdellovibrionota bacterium]